MKFQFLQFTNLATIYNSLEGNSGYKEVKGYLSSISAQIPDNMKSAELLPPHIF